MVLEIRHQVDDDREVEVGLAVDHILDIAHRLDPGLHRRLELIVGDRLLAALIDGLLDDLAHHRLAELLLEEGDRRLAGAETLEVDARLHLFQPPVTRLSSSLAGTVTVNWRCRSSETVSVICIDSYVSQA